MTHDPLRMGIILVAIMLSGCGAQDYANDSDRVCIDGVQYIVMNPDTSMQALSPHLKPDGKPYLCEAPK